MTELPPELQADLAMAESVFKRCLRTKLNAGVLLGAAIGIALLDIPVYLAMHDARPLWLSLIFTLAPLLLLAGSVLVVWRHRSWRKQLHSFMESGNGHT